MNIQPASLSVTVGPVTGAEGTGSVAAAHAPAVGPSAGQAATWWVSPPGQFFSILSQVSQQYPIELKQAIALFAEGAIPVGAAPPEQQALEMLASQISSSAQVSPPSYQSYGHPPLSPTTTASAVASANVTPFSRLVTTMRHLSETNPSQFTTVTTGLAASFSAVASAPTGAGTADMANLASQLQQAAQRPPGESRPDEPEPGPVPEPVIAAGRVRTT